MRYVVIGAGPAGVTACETLRKEDPGAEITLVGDEPEPPYSRMAIPYLLSDRIAESGTYLRQSEDHYARHGVALRQGRVTRVNPESGRLALELGGEIAFDRLLIATGASPVVPEVEGIDVEGVYPCWTLADARQILARARPGSRVVLIGAGFIGCIILESLVARGVDLTVVEIHDRMVPRMLNATAGGLLKRWCGGKGVRVITSGMVSAIGGGTPLAVDLDDGQTLPADLVIRATGVWPNIGFLDGTGVDVDQGVLVDEYLQSSVPGVYAAGDACQGKEFSKGGYQVLAIQPTAVEHGRIAATNMVREGALRHQGNLNMNILDTMGLVSASFGLWDGVDGGDGVELLDADRYRYLSLQFEEDCLVGANSLGLVEHVGVIRGLIQSRVRLGVWKRRLQQDPTRLMEAYLAAAQGVAGSSV